MPYCQYIVFPHCLRMLELLQTQQFVTNLKRADFKDHLLHQQRSNWVHQQQRPLGGSEG